MLTVFILQKRLRLGSLIKVSERRKRKSVGKVSVLKQWYRADHGLVNYIDTKAKCSHLKKLTSQSFWYFRPSFVNASRTFSLASSPLPCVKKCSIQYLRIQCVKGGMGSYQGRGPQTVKHLPKCPFIGPFFQMTTFSFGVYIVTVVFSFFFSLYIICNR